MALILSPRVFAIRLIAQAPIHAAAIHISREIHCMRNPPPCASLPTMKRHKREAWNGRRTARGGATLFGLSVARSTQSVIRLLRYARNDRHLLPLKAPQTTN